MKGLSSGVSVSNDVCVKRLTVLLLVSSMPMMWELRTVSMVGTRMSENFMSEATSYLGMLCIQLRHWTCGHEAHAKHSHPLKTKSSKLRAIRPVDIKHRVSTHDL